MFSGIVEAIGRITDVEDRDTTRRFLVEVPEFASQLDPSEALRYE